MVQYPVLVQLNGKKAHVRSREEFLSNYDKIFDAGVKCAILKAKKQDVWGNWQGFTVSNGAVWWEANGISDSAPFKIRTVNNGSYLDGCDEEKGKTGG
jgi:hypothetical protein